MSFSLSSLSTFFRQQRAPIGNKLEARSILAEYKIPTALFLPLHGERKQLRNPKVAVAQYVLKGEIIADNEQNTLPLHASTSGKIVAITEHPSAYLGAPKVPTMILEPDGKDAWIDLVPFNIIPSQEELNTTLKLTSKQLDNLHIHLSQAGIVGMGGAGFSTFDKILLSYQSQVHTIIVNLCECEPIISCDEGLSTNHTQEIVLGICLLMTAIQAKKTIIVIEDNKPLVAEKLRQTLVNYPTIELRVIATIYPSGYEKLLVQLVSGIKLKSFERPYEYGYAVFNVATCYAIYRSLVRGEPLIQRLITVSNGDLGANRWALLGTPFSDLLEWQNIQHDSEKQQLIMGGPMNGIAIEDSHIGTLKTTNCLLSLAQTTHQSKHSPCIRCGDCATVCPVNLLPQQLFWFAQSEQHDKAEEYRLFDCIECGNCAYVCPSKIPLVQFYRRQKNQISAQRIEKQQAILAKERYDKRNARLQRERLLHQQQVQQKRLQAQQKLATMKSTQSLTEDSSSKQPVSQAVARAKARAMAKKQNASK